MEAWNKAISDYRIKAILKMCSALTAWTWVNKEHRTESTSSVCRMFKCTHTYSPLPARFRSAFCSFWKNTESLMKFFHRSPPLKENVFKKTLIILFYLKDVKQLHRTQTDSIQRTDAYI